MFLLNIQNVSSHIVYLLFLINDQGFFYVGTSAVALARAKEATVRYSVAQYTTPLVHRNIIGTLNVTINE